MLQRLNPSPNGAKNAPRGTMQSFPMLCHVISVSSNITQCKNNLMFSAFQRKRNDSKISWVRKVIGANVKCATNLQDPTGPDNPTSQLFQTISKKHRTTVTMGWEMQEKDRRW